MMRFLAVGLGGFVGAVARYGLSSLVTRLTRGAFPYGTLVVNVIGCLTIGGLLAWFEGQELPNDSARLFMVVGVLGSFTTFSTFGNDTLEAFRMGAYSAGFMNIGLNVIVGLAAVLVGRMAVGQLITAAAGS